MLIRTARPEDGPALAEIYRPHVEGSAVSFEAEAPDGEEMARRIAARWPMHPWLVAQDPSGAIVGYAYAGPYRERAAYRWCCEATAYVASGQSGRGIGLKLYDRLCELLIWQGYTTAYGVITLPNPASVALHERAGFAHFATYRNVGFKAGAWRDVGWWQRDLAPRQTPQPELRPLTPERLAALV